DRALRAGANTDGLRVRGGERRHRLRRAEREGAAMKKVFAFARLELSDALRSKWLAFASLLYLGLLGTFVWLGLRESSVLGFTGLSRVLLNLSNAVIVVFPLVVLIGT